MQRSLMAKMDSRVCLSLAPRERHNIIYGTKEMAVKAGDVVLVKSEERNGGKWKLGVLEMPIEGRDGVIRAV